MKGMEQVNDIILKLIHLRHKFLFYIKKFRMNKLLFVAAININGP